VRPYAVECLRELSKYFEIIVLTASHECYANVVIDYLDPYKELISYRFYRESCYKTEEGFYVKDLRVFGRDLSSILLVDNVNYR
jgi:CTD small phosphatase-like protein 2